MSTLNLEWRFNSNGIWYASPKPTLVYAVRKVHGVYWVAEGFDPYAAPTNDWQHPDPVKYSHNAMKLCEQHWEAQQ